MGVNGLELFNCIKLHTNQILSFKPKYETKSQLVLPNTQKYICFFSGRSPIEIKFVAKGLLEMLSLLFLLSSEPNKREQHIWTLY